MDKNAKTPKEWVAIVGERIKLAEDWENRRTMLRNLNYYLGNQWITWDSSTKRMVIAPQEGNIERITHNVIKGKVLIKVAKQIKNKIKFEVIPDTTDDERVDIARGANKGVRYWWKEQEMNRKSRDLFLHCGVKGWSATKTYFDPELGDDITPEVDEGEQPEEPIFTGEIVCLVIDPLSLYLDPAATSEDELRWAIERKPRDIDYIAEKYGVQVPEDKNVDYMNSDISINSSFSNMQQNKKMTRMAMVDEMWVKPCKKYPNGLKVTVSNGQLLDLDDKAGGFPYTIFVDTPVPGFVKGEAFIKDMLPIQRLINIMKTMMATHGKRMGNSIWKLPHGSIYDEEELTNEISAIIEYDSQHGEPHREPPPDLPSFFDRLLGFYKQDIDDMSGAREITQAALPPGLDTLGGLQLMVEQENEKLSISAENYERGMKRVLKRVLMLMKKHYTEERMLKIVGDDGQLEVSSFLGSDLSGGEDIDIVEGSSLPEMKSAQQERIMNLWKEGAFVDKNGQPDHQTFLRLLGLGDADAIFEETQLDENKAKTENKVIEDANSPENQKILMQYAIQMQQYQMAMQQFQQQAQMMAQQGEDTSQLQQMQPQPPQNPVPLPPVRDFQDHQTHIYHHNLFRKSGEYDKLPPVLQQMIDDHVNQHTQMLNDPAVQQAQQPAQSAALQQQQAEQQAQQQQMQLQAQQHADDNALKQKQMEVQMQVHATTAQQKAQEIDLQHKKMEMEHLKHHDAHALDILKHSNEHQLNISKHQSDHQIKLLAAQKAQQAAQNKNNGGN